MVPDSESAVGALCTCQEGGHYGDGVHHHCAHTLGAQRLTTKAMINILATPSHWITYQHINMRVGAAT